MRYARAASAMRVLVAGMLALAVVVGAHIAVALEIPELAERTKPSVVLITVYDSAGRKLGTGTGFFVAADGRIVTNVHVIEDAGRATATVSDGRVLELAGVLAKDADADVAVLQASGTGSYPALALGDTRGLVAGQEVVVIGSPMGLAGTLSTGIIAAIREKGPLDDDHPSAGPSGDSWGIQITAPISPGSSGSPILTRDGRVVAVAVGTRVGGENLNFGVPVEKVRALLDRLADHAAPRPFATASPRSELLRNLSISAAVFAGCGLAYAVWRRRRNRPAMRARPSGPRPS
jgi:serine protease Do